MAVTIRAALLEDAEAGAACHIACWREAYATIVDAAVLAERTDDLTERTERWRRIIADLGTRWLAVADSGDVVGFSAAGPGRDDDIAIKLELYAIYVRSAYQGSGIADRLLSRAIGDAPAYLWVFEANPRAQAFYARHRFRPDGARKDEPFFGEPEIRMVRRLSDGGRTRRAATAAIALAIGLLAAWMGAAFAAVGCWGEGTSVQTGSQQGVWCDATVDTGWGLLVLLAVR